MRKTTALKSSLVAAAALTSALGLVGSASASTTGTWTVSGFPEPSPSTVTGTSTNTVLTDPSTGTQLKCATATVTVKGTNGSGQSGTPLATVVGATWSNCSGPLGITFAVTAQNLPWNLNAASYNSTTGVTTGSITGIEAHISGVGCTADFRGVSATVPATVNGTYTNSSHKLTVNATPTDLHAWNVSGACSGLINTGDAVTYTGDYTTSSPVTITSP